MKNSSAHNLFQRRAQALRLYELELLAQAEGYLCAEVMMPEMFVHPSKQNNVSPGGEEKDSRKIKNFVTAKGEIKKNNKRNNPHPSVTANACCSGRRESK